MARSKMYGVSFFMCCIILSPGLFAMDSILGTTVSRFTFQVTEPHNVHELEQWLTFILDDYIPGEPQSVTAYHQMGSLNFVLPLSLADLFPELPGYYRPYFRTSQNNYRMAAFILLVYFSRLRGIALDTITMTSRSVYSGVHFIFTSSATPYIFRVDISINTHEEMFSAQIHYSREGVWSFERGYTVTAEAYDASRRLTAQGEKIKKTNPLTSVTCRPPREASPLDDDDNGDDDDNNKTSCCGFFSPGTFFKHLRNNVIKPSERSSLIE